MADEVGIGAYFNQGRIRIRYKTIKDLGYPEYIHLRLNEEKKYLFIEGCEQDMDAFRIRYVRDQDGKKVMEPSCYINSKKFLEFLADVIGVPVASPSLRFAGRIMPDGTVFIDLNRYMLSNDPRIPRSASASGSSEKE